MTKDVETWVVLGAEADALCRKGYLTLFAKRTAADANSANSAAPNVLICALHMLTACLRVE